MELRSHKVEDPIKVNKCLMYCTGALKWGYMLCLSYELMRYLVYEVLTCLSGSRSLIFREYWYEALQHPIFCLGLYIFGMIFANIVKYCISRNFSKTEI